MLQLMLHYEIGFSQSSAVIGVQVDNVWKDDDDDQRTLILSNTKH